MLLNTKKYILFSIFLFVVLLTNSWFTTKALNDNKNIRDTDDQYNIKTNNKKALDWIRFSPILEKFSAPLYQYIHQSFLEENTSKLKDKVSKNIAKTTQNNILSNNLSNIIINDINQEDSLKIQNQTASAAFGENIVVVYNKTGLFRTSASYSFDGGTNWQETTVNSLIGGANIGNSAIAVDNSGNFYVANVAVNRANLITVALSRSEDGGVSWLPATDVVGANVRTRFIHDRPWIAIDNRSRAQVNVYVSWTQFDDMEKRSSIMFARSINGGIRFTTPIEITPNTKGFNTDGSRLAIGPNGEIYLTWVNNQTGTFFLAKSTNNGVSFSSPKEIATLGLLRTPAFLNGSFNTNIYPSLTVDTSNTQTQGFIYLTYNGRTRINSPDKSDIFLLCSTDGGESWSKAVKVNDDETITDQWMPSVTVNSSGKVALLWYDRRNNPVNNSLIDVYATTSFDGGKSFSKNLRVTDTSWPLVPSSTQIAFGSHGEYNQISTQGDFVNLHWADDRNGTDPNIFFAKLPFNETEKPDFSLSGRTIFATARVGESVTFLGESLRVGAFNDFIQLSATSDLPNIDLRLLTEEIFAGNGFNLTAFIPNNTRPGNYVITITGSSKDRSRSTVVRLSVLNNEPEAKVTNNLTRNTGESTRPKIITDSQGFFHMVWQDDTEGVAAIFYANSLDGKDFSSPTNLSRNFDPALRPTIASDKQGRIHIVWQEANPLGNFLVYTRTDDLGKTFLPKRIITPDIANSLNAVLAVDLNDTINLVWSANLPNSQTAILLAESKDGGENFVITKTLASTAKPVIYEPILAIDSKNTFHLAYSMLEVTRQRFDSSAFTAGLFYQRSVSEKFDFAEPINLIPRDFILADSPVLLADGLGQVVLIFAGFNSRMPFPSREIYYTQSFDNGASFFFSPNTISNGNGDSTAVAAVYGKDRSLNVIWRDTLRQNFDIYINRLMKGERNFIGSKIISQNLGISDFPTIALGKNGSMVIAWADDSIGSSEIFYSNLTLDDFPEIEINSFSPLQAAISETVNLRGSNFNDVGEVKVGELSAKFRIISDQEIELTIPNGAVSSKIRVFSFTALSSSKDVLLIKDKVGVKPVNIDFGQISLGKSVTKSFQLVNSSNTPRTIRGILFTNLGFSLDKIKFPLMLAANSTMDIGVTFTPNILSLQGGLALILTDNQNSIDLAVELIGIGLDALAPSVATLTPLGGEEFTPGQQVRITWRTQDNSSIARQEILLSTDGGNSFPITIASGLVGVRDFIWTVPEINTTMAKIKIVAIDLSNNRGEGVTERTFTIKAKRR
ncbi:MAG: hypothetical protein HY819_00165 [Acidobacteria bacterium]|nr:hypothetical protein [Acidobacteriota bacterium]